MGDLNLDQPFYPIIEAVNNSKQRKLASNFRDNVIKKRKELGIRQIDLAERCNISVKYIADIEQGKAGNPTLETICEIANGLNINVPLELLS